ncbi:MAG: sugar phosphate isomerase/epimerase [Clostridiales bacterium]|nr:sugar phosphate isomerase/epimerase [Clostridiales bacterium]
MKLGTFVRPSMDNPDAAFAPLAEMGFTCCQLAYKPPVFLKEDAEKIRAAADRHGIEISAHFIGYRDGYGPGQRDQRLRFGPVMAGLTSPSFGAQRLEYLMQGCEFVKWLGITDLIIHAGYIPYDPFDPAFTQLVAYIRVLGKRCKDLGLNLLFETGAESPLPIMRLIHESGLDNLYINLDTGNGILYGTHNPVDALYSVGHLVRNLHMKDALPPVDCYELGKETAFGDGIVDFERCVKRLAELGYDRYMVIEREVGTTDQQKRDILNAKLYLEELLKKYAQNA